MNTIALAFFLPLKSEAPKYPRIANGSVAVFLGGSKITSTSFGPASSARHRSNVIRANCIISFWSNMLIPMGEHTIVGAVPVTD